MNAVSTMQVTAPVYSQREFLRATRRTSARVIRAWKRYCNSHRMALILVHVGDVDADLEVNLKPTPFQLTLDGLRRICDLLDLHGARRAGREHPGWSMWIRGVPLEAAEEIAEGLAEIARSSVELRPTGPQYLLR